MTLLCCAHKMISPNLAVWPAEKLTRRLLEIFRSRISMAFSLQPHLSCFSKMCHKYHSYFSLVEVRETELLPVKASQKPKKATLLSVLKILTPKGSYSTFRVGNSTMKGIMESGQDLLCFFLCLWSLGCASSNHISTWLSSRQQT